MPTSTRSRLLAPALLAIVALGLAACGDTSEPDDAAADDAADDGGAECSTPGETVTVNIGDFLFDPTPVQIGACDSVVWHNGHTQPHTSTGTGEQAWNTGNVAPDADSEPVAFETAGTYAYICALHPFMKGTVEVA
jgi:plastocyanin